MNWNEGWDYCNPTGSQFDFNYFISKRASSVVIEYGTVSVSLHFKIHGAGYGDSTNIKTGTQKLAHLYYYCTR